MRFTGKGIVTLEMDIQRIWKKHGWQAVEERKKGRRTWIIKAKPSTKRQEKSHR